MSTPEGPAGWLAPGNGVPAAVAAAGEGESERRAVQRGQQGNCGTTGRPSTASCRSATGATPLPPAHTGHLVPRSDVAAAGPWEAMAASR